MWPIWPACRSTHRQRRRGKRAGRRSEREGRSLAPGRPSLGEVVVKTIVTHTVTYFLIGLAAFWCFGYARKFAEPGVRSLMRQTDEPLVMAGPLFQPIRGLLF